MCHDSEVSLQSGAKFCMKRELLMSTFGAQYNDPPWGELIAVDLADGTDTWRSVFGTTEVMIGLPLPWGTPDFGGAMMTSSGLIFTGAAMDDYICAFNNRSGEKIWKAALPASGQATPMSCEWQSKQYVPIVAGGHSTSGTTQGDYVVSFALPG